MKHDVSEVCSASIFGFLIFVLVQVSFLSLIINFYFLIAVFLLLPLDKIWSQLHILTRFLVCSAHWLRIYEYLRSPLD